MLIDATIIRGVLLPTAMALLGERNWYFPKWLRWLPDMTHEESYDDVPDEAAPVLGGGEPERVGV